MPIDFLTVLLHPPGQPAVAFFTRGPELHFQEGVPISTGSWVVNPHRIFLGITVIIYHRTNAVNNIYVGTCNHISRPLGAGPHFRYRLGLADSHFADITHNNWPVCAQTGTNPMKYFNR
jgi:hypothetical protein